MESCKEEFITGLLLQGSLKWHIVSTRGLSTTISCGCECNAVWFDTLSIDQKDVSHGLGHKHTLLESLRSAI